MATISFELEESDAVQLLILCHYFASQESWHDYLVLWALVAAQIQDQLPFHKYNDLARGSVIIACAEK